jgi:hypothetical protein
MTKLFRRALVLGGFAAVVLSGCSSPEDGRARGGGHGGDGGNYTPAGVHVPSKIDGTKTWTDRPKA